MGCKAKTVLAVDISDMRALVSKLRLVYSEKTFHQIMYRVFRRAATRTKTLTQKEVPADYNAKKPWIGQAFGSPTITTGHKLECSIPLDGTRGYIGKTGVFRASATAPGGAASVRKAYAGRKGKRTRRAYKINAQIVTSGSTVLSSKTTPHFMVFSGKHKGRVFVRMNKKGDKIRPAVGIGVPQMPMTRTKRAIQDGVLEIIKLRIEHEHAHEMRKAAGRWMH